MSRVVHFEIPVQDMARARKFYTSVFGWKLENWGGPVEYWLATTGEEGTPGINGGLYSPEAGDPRTGVTNTLDVADVDEAVAKIIANGGAVVVPKMPVPGVGWLVYFKDSEGNVSGIMQADPSAQ
jgi:predicted enzyme related to lactoylglutathione lyase